MAIDFFANTSDVRKFVKGIDAGVLIDSFDPPFRPAKMRLINLIGQETYDLLLAYYANPDPEDELKAAAVEYAQGALANILALAYFYFDSGNRNNTDNNLYRYQEDKIIEQYIENAYSELSFLITILESDTTKFSDFAATDTYKNREKLYIKSANQFDQYYNIDKSAYFFYNATYLMVEVQSNAMFARIKGFPAMEESLSTNEDLIYAIGKAIAFETMSKACLRLDYTELPKGIRNDIIKEIDASVDRTKLMNVKEALSVRLHEEGKEYFRRIETEINKAKNSGTIIIPDDINNEDNKFYLQT